MTTAQRGQAIIELLLIAFLVSTFFVVGFTLQKHGRKSIQEQEWKK